MAAELIIYGFVAAGLVIWLRSILGTRSEDENQLFSSSASIEKKSPDSPEAERSFSAAGNAEKIIELAKNSSGVMFIENKTAEMSLLEIVRQDKSFDVKFFLQAVQDVFALVVECFAQGDREMLKDLLGGPVHAAFDSAIVAREGRGETQVSEVHSIDKAGITAARLEEGRYASITVRFVVSQTSVTRDSSGKIIAGNPDKATKMVDIWTFGRDIKSSDPRWLVMETRGDFEGDNDLIPNAE